jgi:hypothetical protein
VERRGQVTLGEIESTGNRTNSLSCRKAAAFQGWHEPDESRDLNREIHVRLCERLGAKFPGPTRRRRGDSPPYADRTFTPCLPAALALR